MQIPDRSTIALVLLVAYIIFFPGLEAVSDSSPWWVVSGPIGFVVAAFAVWPFSWLLRTREEMEGPRELDLVLVGIAGMLLSRWIAPGAVMFFPYFVMAFTAAIWRWKSLSLAWFGTLAMLGLGLFAATQGFEPHMLFYEHIELMALLAISAFVLLLGGLLLAIFFAMAILFIDIVSFGQLSSRTRVQNHVWDEMPDFVRACYGGLSVAVVATFAAWELGFELSALAGLQLYMGTPMLFSVILLIIRVQRDRRVISV